MIKFSWPELSPEDRVECIEDPEERRRARKYVDLVRAQRVGPVNVTEAQEVVGDMQIPCAELDAELHTKGLELSLLIVKFGISTPQLLTTIGF